MKKIFDFHIHKNSEIERIMSNNNEAYISHTISLSYHSDFGILYEISLIKPSQLET